MACKRLDGTSSTVEFVISQTTLERKGEITLRAIDRQGVFSEKRFYANPHAGPKIEGPWVWMIVPTGKFGPAAATSGIDYLAEVSGGAATEKQIAIKGAMAGDAAGDKVWTPGKIAPTSDDNITEMVNAIGLGEGDIDNHVAYGSIALNAPRAQKTTMHVGSDDAVKVWLNGDLVHNNPADRPASGYQENFPVTLKQGKNILLVAVYEGIGYWSGFFGFDKDTEYRLPAVPIVLVEKFQRPPMYWIDMQTGGLHSLIETNVERLVPRVQNATHLAVDVAAGKIYWVEKTGEKTSKIRRANPDGSAVELVKDLTSVPLALAIDAANGKLYVANAWGKLQRMNPDGSDFQSNFITDLESPKDIALDVGGGKLYWIEQTGDKTGKIRRADLNGSNVELVKDLTSRPLAIAIDPVNRKLYVANAWGKLQRMNPDGSDFQSNFITDLETPTAIAVLEGKLYWTEQGSIRRSNLNGESIEDIAVGLGTPTSIALVAVPEGAPIPAAPGLVRMSPNVTVLLHNYPNPFNPETWIPYQLAKPAEVRVTIYDIHGRVVRALDLGHQRAGTYQTRSRAAYWDGRNAFGEPVASGLYFYTLTAGDFSATRKMLIRK